MEHMTEFIMEASTHAIMHSSMILDILLFRQHPRQKIDNFLFDSYYSTNWKNNYFIVVEYLGFLR